MIEAHTALTKRNKASLQSFIDKNDWIQSKIRHLKSSRLPPIDAESSELDDAVLSELLSEHDRVEAEVQELDNGELKSLRMLAKAASSQKNLSSEDTDLIEITLKVLFSVDKLLHLLRIRGKELHLLQLKIKWETSLKKAEADCSALLHKALPAFLHKARWKEPEEMPLPSGPSGSAAPSDHPVQLSPSSRRTTLTNSIMSRQLRAEILSLDLAALTSRIHTLSHTTLPASAKFLDSMVDISPAPLPESFLDRQDEVEAGLKQNLSGLVDFCQTLARQWRHVDEVYWTMRELRLCLDALRRDINEATLKLPSETLADAFSERMNDAQAKYDASTSVAIAALPKPLLAAHLPDQASYNVQVAEALQQAIQRTSAPLKACRDAVNAYRKAAQALAAAQTYHKQTRDLLTEIRQQKDSLSLIPVELATVTNAEFDLFTTRTHLEHVRRLAEHAQSHHCTQAHDIILSLLDTGIDPNFRRSLQDSIAALQRDSKQALLLADSEERKMAALGQVRSFLASFINTREALSQHATSLTSSIRSVLAEESQDRLPPPANLDGQTVALLQRVSHDLSSYDRIRDTLDTLGNLESTTHLRAYVRREVADMMNADKRVRDLLDLLHRVLKQQEQRKLAEEQAARLDLALQDLSIDVTSARLGTSDLEGLQARYGRLADEIQAYKQAVVSEISFLSGTKDIEQFDLNRRDASVRFRINEKCAEVQSRLRDTGQNLDEVRNAVEAGHRLQREQEQIQATLNQAESVRSDKQLTMVGRLEKLQALRMAHQDLLDIESSENIGISHQNSDLCVYQDVRALQASNSSQRDEAVRTLSILIHDVEAEILCQQNQSFEDREQLSVKQSVPLEAMHQGIMPNTCAERDSADLESSDARAQKSQDTPPLLCKPSSSLASDDSQDDATAAYTSQHGTTIEDVGHHTASEQTKGQPSVNASDDVGYVSDPNADDIEAFLEAAKTADQAISHIIDMLDDCEEGKDSSNNLQTGLIRAEQDLQSVERAAMPCKHRASVQRRLAGLQTIWQEVRGHADDMPFSNKPPSRKDHQPEELKSSTAVPARSDGGESEKSRPASATASSRLPVACNRLRRDSAASVPSGFRSPRQSQLPRPASAGPNGFRTPTLASNARSIPGIKKYSTLAPLGSPRLPSSSLHHSFTSHNSRQGPNVIPRKGADDGKSRGENHRQQDTKPNRYQAKPNHKLDTAVGRIVNEMPVLVNVKPAEVQGDEVGKYWIGDPPKLYYARILRSRTVMLRVGGGWQELGSFLTTHLSQPFSAGEGLAIAPDTDNENESLSAPLAWQRDAIPKEGQRLSAVALKASQGASSSRRSSFKSPRSIFLAMSPLRQSHGGDMTFDLTALLVKSTSHSPPAVHCAGGANRNASAPVPWKL